jgi:phage I-like protein
MSKTAAALSLCSFRAAGVDAFQAGQDLPTRLVVAPWGTHDARGRGKVIIDETTLSAFSASQKALRLDDQVALDFDHNTVEGTPAFKADKEPRLVAAFGTPSVEHGVGIILSDLRWTPEGIAALTGGHFQDLSPAVFRRADGTVFALHSAGLCKHGEIDGLTIAAGSGLLSPQFAALSASLPQPIPMKHSDALIALLLALGVTLAPDADEATTEAAFKSAAEAVDKMKTETEIEISPLSAQVTALTAQVQAMQATRDTDAKTALVSAASAAGKVIALSADQILVTPLSVLQTLVDAAKPGEVPLTRLTTEKEIVATTPEAFTATDSEIFARFGLTAADVALYAPKPVK